MMHWYWGIIIFLAGCAAGWVVLSLTIAAACESCREAHRWMEGGEK